MVADPQSKKRLTEKRLIFTGQKISLLAHHKASLELDSGLPVKSRKIDRKIDFFENFFEEQKKYYVLKWPEKNSLRDSLNTLKAIFYFWNFKSSICFQMSIVFSVKRFSSLFNSHFLILTRNFSIQHSLWWPQCAFFQADKIVLL